MVVADIVSRSAATRERLPMSEAAYGDGPSETLDIFVPPGTTGPLPVHMFIHGGYWRMFSKRDYSLVAETVAEAGAIAVIVDYALMPGVRMASIVDQVGRAKQWVFDNIGAFGGDPSRLTVSGHSAGAQLAALLFRAGAAPSGIQAALLLGGLYDLAPLQKSFLQAEIGLTDEEVRRFTPLLQAYDAGTSVSVLVGSRETPPFHDQAGAFTKLLGRQGLDVSYRLIAGRHHMDSVRDLGDSSSLAGIELTKIVACTS
ncbi:alpha/beta hydrolase [Devosia sp. LC5]|uniref:alpha/beta hydrolase n=1 Tax=Devosia sp. LC5 TaxID=1502724 RepID=UPI000B279CA0|nr:alpha/beta hydrolase [Devosia sp. LC5]